MSTGEGTAGSQEHPEINWAAAAKTDEFRELISRKRRFVLPATLFFMAWYFGFIVLAGYAPGFMGESIYEGFTVGYALALSQFVMVWVLAAWYLRRANRDFDPLAERARQRAVELSQPEESEPGPGRPRRFEPPDNGRDGSNGARAQTHEEARR